MRADAPLVFKKGVAESAAQKTGPNCDHCRQSTCSKISRIFLLFWGSRPLARALYRPRFASAFLQERRVAGAMSGARRGRKENIRTFDSAERSVEELSKHISSSRSSRLAVACRARIGFEGPPAEFHLV
jgi:hypothetical protein